MASFKLNIADTKTGKCYKKEVKDQQASPFIGLKISESIKGDGFDMPGYEFVLTGGADYCGFPMRRGILGTRKKISLLGGVGFKGAAKGIKRRKTVCGHKVNEQIVQINLKVTKQGSKGLADIFGAKEEAPKEAKEEKKEEPKPEVKAEEKKEKPEEKEEAKAEEKKSEVKEEKADKKEPEKKEVSETQSVSDDAQKAKLSDKPKVEEKKEEAKEEKKEEPKPEAKEEKK